GQEVLFPLRGHSGAVHAVAVASGKLVSGGSDHTLRVWDVSRARPILAAATAGLSAAPPGIGPLAAVVALAARHTPPLRILKGHKGTVYSVASTRDGSRLASASADGTMKVWDADTARELFTCTHGGAVHSVCFSPDDKRVASASADRTVK